MGDLSLVRPKLAALLPRLASTSDGEVVATARAIGRQLHRAGADWHALAEAVTAEPRERVVYVEREPEHEHDDAEAAVLWLARRSHRLRPRERRFVEDLAIRARIGSLRLTERQLSWLVAIYSRVLREEGGGDDW